MSQSWTGDFKDLPTWWSWQQCWCALTSWTWLGKMTQHCISTIDNVTTIGQMVTPCYIWCQSSTNPNISGSKQQAIRSGWYTGTAAELHIIIHESAGRYLTLSGFWEDHVIQLSLTLLSTDAIITKLNKECQKTYEVRISKGRETTTQYLGW
jgi:hypothetical protein